MKKYNWKQWLSAAGIRAVKTMAQTACATIGTTALINKVEWLVVVYSSLLAGIISLLTSIAGLPELDIEALDELDVKEFPKLEETDQ